MPLKSGFSDERKCYIYNISISLYASLFLHTYSGVLKRGWGEGAKRRYNPAPLLRTVSGLQKYCRKVFPITAPTLNRGTPNKHFSSFFTVLLVDIVKV